MMLDYVLNYTNTIQGSIADTIEDDLSDRLYRDSQNCHFWPSRNFRISNSDPETETTIFLLYNR